MNVYEHITRLKEAGFWRAELGLYHRANTLDFQYRLYTLMQQLEPEHTYGYLFRLLNNRQIINLLGGGVRAGHNGTEERKTRNGITCIRLSNANPHPYSKNHRRRHPVARRAMAVRICA